RRYTGLVLFFSSVSLLYLVVNAFLPIVVKAPIWHFLGQFAPLAIGSSYLVTGSKGFQKWLLARASTTSFMLLMLAAILVLGAAGFTRLPNFKVPVQYDPSIDSYCSQIVDGVDDAMVGKNTSQTG